jgi:hypothetical protein
MLQAAADVLAGKAPHGSTNAEAYRVRSGDAMSGCNAKLADVLEQRFGQHAGVSMDVEDWPPVLAVLPLTGLHPLGFSPVVA